jgi:hypothetical protein
MKRDFASDFPPQRTQRTQRAEKKEGVLIRIRKTLLLPV